MQSFSGVAGHPFQIFARSVVTSRCPSSTYNFIILTFFFQLTDQFEGNLIRVFRRLGELLRQMTQAAKVIGNSELQEKFQKASEMLERPNSVIFCSSLYL